MPRAPRYWFPILACTLACGWLLASAITADAQQQTASGNAALIAKGEYLARAGDCIACHTVREGKLFAGGLPMKTPFGTLYTSNITPDP